MIKGRSFVLTSTPSRRLEGGSRRSVEKEFCNNVLSQMFRVAEQQCRWADFEYCGNDVWLCRTACRGEGGSDENDDCDADCDTDTN